jgi:transposase
MNKITSGIDVHYKQSNFYFINETTQEEFYKVIPTAKSPILKMLEEFQGYRIQYAFETGTMARFLYGILSSLSNTEKIHVVHPKKFKVIVESKHKNDKIDSKKLAEGLSKDYLPMPVYMKSERCRRLQMLLNLRRSRVKNKVATVMQAKSIVRSLGIQRTGVITKRRGFDNLVESIEKETYDRGILERLRTSFIADLDAIDQIECEIKEMIELDFANEYGLLLSIPGIGFITAASLIAKIDLIDRFKNADVLSSYLGLVPSEHSSGSKVSHGKITKEGDTEIRWLLIQSAWTIIRIKKEGDGRGSALRKKFYRIAMKEKNTKKAIVAIARHISRIVYGVLKSKTPYSGDIHG